MTVKDFEAVIVSAVNDYIENFDRYDSNPQLAINPMNLSVSLINESEMADAIEDSDEAVENAAIAQGIATQDAADYQVKRNPDFYPVKSFLRPLGDTDVPDKMKIYHLAARYVKA